MDFSANLCVLCASAVFPIHVCRYAGWQDSRGGPREPRRCGGASFVGDDNGGVASKLLQLHSDIAGLPGSIMLTPQPRIPLNEGS
jgi:hypothetical protein